MDYALSDEQRALQAAAREFARGEMAAVAEEVEREARPVSRDWVTRYAEMGFLGVNVSPRYGGLGLGNVDAFRWSGACATRGGGVSRGAPSTSRR